MRIHRSRGSDAESAFGNMLLVSLCGLFYSTAHKGAIASKLNISYLHSGFCHMHDRQMQKLTDKGRS